MVLAVQNELKKNSSNISYDVHAVLENGHVQIASGTNTRFELSNLWLRDNCLCDECRNVETEEKSFILSTVSCDLTPSMVDLTEDILSIGWPDGHQSDTDQCKDILLGWEEKGSNDNVDSIPSQSKHRQW